MIRRRMKDEGRCLLKYMRDPAADEEAATVMNYLFQLWGPCKARACLLSQWRHVGRLWVCAPNRQGRLSTDDCVSG